MIRQNAGNWHELIAYHKGPPKVENPFTGKDVTVPGADTFNPFNQPKGGFGENLVKGVVSYAGSPVRNAQNQTLPTLDNALRMATGSETDMEKEARKQTEGVQAEADARAKAFQDITSEDLDSISREELFGAYNSGASSSDLAAKLAAARSGKGIYAVRKINEAQKKVISMAPGRAQLSGRYSISV